MRRRLILALVAALGLAALFALDGTYRDQIQRENAERLAEHQLQGEARFGYSGGVTWWLRFSDALYTARV